jgi:hypothetical protein
MASAYNYNIEFSFEACQLRHTLKIKSALVLPSVPLESNIMPIELSHGRVVVLIRQSAFERGGFTRHAIDDRYNLADDEFRVEDSLIALGPLPADDLLPELIDDLEKSGLTYFDDFFELSGNWPAWLTLCARGSKARGT